MRSSDIVRTARTFLDVKWVHGGRGRNGVDCAGLVAVTAKALKYPFIDEVSYSREPVAYGHLTKLISRNGIQIGINDRRTGDVGIFWMDARTKFDQHVGIFTDVGLIHSYTHVGKVVETNIGRWEKRLMSVVRFRGRED